MSLQPILVAALLVTAAASAQSIPKEIWGKWTVQRELPTRTISCWGDADAKKLIGTQIEYSDKVFRWERTTTPNPVAEVKMVSAEQFRAQNSSPSSNGSQIDFRQLGIGAPAAMEISIQHKPANITGATVEIPGDDVLVKNADTIVFSVCSLYFEAKRSRDRK
jgi:hypothetical protein